jgi:putative ABC transport system permease protein
VKNAERWQLAIRGLLRRPVRTLLTLLGLVVALTSMLLFLSLGEGLKGQLRKELRSVGPDLQVARPAGGLALLPSPSLPAQLVTILQTSAADLGIDAVTPVATQIKQALDPTQSAVYYGLPASQGVQALFPQARAAQGRLLQPGDEGQAVAVLGASAARGLGLGVGGTFMVTRRYRARIVGVLQPLNNLTDTFTFLPLTDAQRAFGTGDLLSFVALRLREPAQAPQVAARLRLQLHSQHLPLEVSTRDDVLRSAGTVLRSADALSLGLSLVALAVGGLAVTNTVMMTVQERTREFAVLRAIGARPQFVVQLVLTESLLLAGLSWAAAAVLTLPGLWAINQITQQIAGINGAALTPRLLGLTLGLSLLLGLLAGWWPARRAGRMGITRALGQP